MERRVQAAAVCSFGKPCPKVHLLSAPMAPIRWFTAGASLLRLSVVNAWRSSRTTRWVQSVGEAKSTEAYVGRPSSVLRLVQKQLWIVSFSQSLLGSPGVRSRFRSVSVWWRLSMPSLPNIFVTAEVPFLAPRGASSRARPGVVCARFSSKRPRWVHAPQDDFYCRGSWRCCSRQRTARVRAEPLERRLFGTLSETHPSD